MARIEPYQSTAPTLQPDESVPGALARGGEVIGSSIRQVGDKLQEIQNKTEMADLTANMAKTKADLEIEWQKRLRETPPDDPKFQTLAQDFNEQVAQPAIEKAGDGFWSLDANTAARQMKGILGADMLRSTAADQAQAQGTYATVRVQKVNNELSQMVENDPAQYDSAQMLRKAMLLGATHGMGLNAQDEAKLDLETGRQIVRAAFQGAAIRSADPELLKKMMADPKYAQYAEQSDLYQYVVDAERQFSMQRAEARAGDADAKQKASENYNSGVNKLLGDAFDPIKGTYQITADTFRGLAELNKDPAVLGGLVPASTVKANIDFFLAMEKKDNQVATDPHAYEDFTNKLIGGTLTDNDVYAARGKTLSDTDASYFLHAIGEMQRDPQRKDAEKQFAHFMADMKPAFTSTNFYGMKDSEGSRKFDAFWHDAHEQFLRAYAAGPDAWKPLFDPHNKAYLGNASKDYINGKGTRLQPQGAPKITGDNDPAYKNLKSGLPFIGPDGVTRIKK